jgi:hypothetical protein
VVEVGVIMYWTVPAVELLGFVRVWLIILPEPALAPVIPPVMVPIVHEKVLGAVDVNAMLGPVPLHILTVARLVTSGLGLTVTIIL